MPIPVNPDLIGNAVPFSTNFTTFPMNVCKAPAEGSKCIPLQFQFANGAAQYCDLSGGIPTVSQISSAYMDCLGSVNSCLIIFPDTGFQVQVNAGKTLLFPVFTGNTSLPKFYMVINGGVPTSDLVNLILLNFFIPEFAAP